MLRRLLISSALVGTALLAPAAANASTAEQDAQAAKCLFPTGIGVIDDFCATKWKAKAQLLGGLSGGFLGQGAPTGDGDYGATPVTPTDLNAYVHPLIVKIDKYPLVTVKGANGPGYVWLGPKGPVVVDEDNIDFGKRIFLVAPKYDCAPNDAPTPGPEPGTGSNGEY